MDASSLAPSGEEQPSDLGESAAAAAFAPSATAATAASEGTAALAAPSATAATAASKGTAAPAAPDSLKRKATDSAGNKGRKKGGDPKTIRKAQLIGAIHQHAKLNQLQPAMATFRSTVEEGVQLHPSVFNTLLYLATGGNNWEAYARGQPAPQPTDGPLAPESPSAPTKQELVDSTQALWEHMQQHGVAVEHAAYVSLARIEAIKGNAEGALAWAKASVAVDPAIQLRLFHPALVSFMLHEDTKSMMEVDRLIASFGREQLDLTEYEYAVMLEGLTLHGAWAQVAELLHRMGKELNQLSPSTLAILEAYFKGPRAAEAFSAASRAQREAAEEQSEAQLLRVRQQQQQQLVEDRRLAKQRFRLLQEEQQQQQQEAREAKLGAPVAAGKGSGSRAGRAGSPAPAPPSPTPRHAGPPSAAPAPEGEPGSTAGAGLLAAASAATPTPAPRSPAADAAPQPRSPTAPAPRSPAAEAAPAPRSPTKRAPRSPSADAAPAPVVVLSDEERRRRRPWLGYGGAQSWQVSSNVAVDPSSSCLEAAGGLRPLVVDLEDQEWASFSAAVAGLAMSLEQRKSEFQNYMDWHMRNGPFDIMIDGANVAFFSTAGNFQWGQIMAMVRLVQQQYPDKKLLLMLHYNRVHHPSVYKDPRVQKFLADLKATKSFYPTPVGSNDDWYWLYAAIQARGGGLLISNDELRDHIWGLLRPKHFLKWKSRHIAHYTFVPGEQGNVPVLSLPSPYTECVQELEDGSWVFPCTDQTWLCASPARE